MAWIDKRKMDEISEAESKKNLEELEKRFLKNNQLENEQKIMNGDRREIVASDIINESKDYPSEDLTANELIEVSKRVEFKPQSALKKMGSFFSKTMFGQPQSSKGLIKPSLAKRGPQKGVTYSKNKTNKYRYLRDSSGRAIKKIGLNPNYKGKDANEYRINKKTGRLQIKLRKTSPQFVKTAFSKGIKKLQTFESQSQFEKKRQAYYKQQEEDYELGLDTGDFGNIKRLNPFLESQEASNSSLDLYHKQMQQSAYEYAKSKIETARRVFLRDQMRKQITENQRQSNQLNSENMFSPNNPFMQNSRIDILQNIFSNAQSIMKKNENSLNLLSTGRPSILQAKSIMQTDPNYDILKTPNLFGGRK